MTDEQHSRWCLYWLRCKRRSEKPQDIREWLKFDEEDQAREDYEDEEVRSGYGSAWVMMDGCE